MAALMTFSGIRSSGQDVMNAAQANLPGSQDLLHQTVAKMAELIKRHMQVTESQAAALQEVQRDMSDMDLVIMAGAISAPGAGGVKDARIAAADMPALRNPVAKPWPNKSITVASFGVSGGASHFNSRRSNVSPLGFGR